MAKKKKESADSEQGAPAPAVETVGEVVFVNRSKLERARDIVDLVSGKRIPRDGGELERKERFEGHFAAHSVSPKDKDAVRFVYETLLCGLVRSPDEQETADREAAVRRTKFKKKAIPAGE